MTVVQRAKVLAAASLVVLAGCDGSIPVTDVRTTLSMQPPSAQDVVVRLAFGGDVMLGRRLAPVVASEPDSVFEAVRHTLGNADVAFANLESPLGRAAADGDPLRLVADPSVAELLAMAGFDAMSVANNHAGDAGADSVAGTVERLADAGVVAVGTLDAGGTPVPVVIERRGVRVAALAFDLTGQSPADEIAQWDEDVAAAAIAAARSVADVVAVSLHGGVEYSPRPDPALSATVEWVAGQGADVVWAHGSHSSYGVSIADPDADGRSALLAYGLGNFVFDQRIAGTEQGLLLEVLAGAGGVRAYRIGVVDHTALRVSAPDWQLPAGDAVLVAGEWWELVDAAPATVGAEGTMSDPRLATLGEVAAASRGDVDGDGEDELVVGFMRPVRPTLVNQRFSDVDWVDDAGDSAHLGVYSAGTMRPEWVAGSLPYPVVAVAVCDDAVALAHRSLDASSVIAGGAWQWRDFGFAAAPSLPGVATPACTDVDGDGHVDPVLLRDRDP